MTKYQKTVLRLLCMIWNSLQQVPGVYQWPQDRKFIDNLEEELGL